MRRAILRILVYVLPLLLWILVAALAATELGSYQKSWNTIHAILGWMQPGFYYADPQVLSMYQLTQATRQLAHVTVYSVLTALIVRLCQAGRPQLRFRSLLLAVVGAAAFKGIENYLRLHQSEGTRHVRQEQLILDAIGVGAMLVGTVAYFGLKALERWLLAESRKTEPELSLQDRV